MKKIAYVAALIALVFVARAQVSYPVPIRETRVVGVVPAEWWTYLRLDRDPSGAVNTTYVVPTGHRLVVTRFMNSPYGYPAADGVVALGKLSGVDASQPLDGVTRVVFEPQTLLSLVNTHDTASAWCDLWGYLEPVSR